MSRRRRERMSEGKKNIIAGLIQDYDNVLAENFFYPKNRVHLLDETPNL